MAQLGRPKAQDAKTDPQVLVYGANRELRADEDAIKMLAEADLFFATKYVFGRDRLVERVHGPFCQFIERPCNKLWNRKSLPAELYGVPGFPGKDWVGDTTHPEFPRETITNSDRNKRTQLVMFPRGAYKSTVVSESLPIWILMNRPDAKIAVAAQSQNDATRRLGTIDQIIRHPRFIRLWGDWITESRNWQKTEKYSAMRRKVDTTPSLWAISPGVWKPGMHPDYVIFDDIVGDKVVDSEERMAEVEQFYHTVQPALGEHACQWFVGTPWGELDLYAQLRKKPNIEQYIRAAYNPDGSLWLPEVVGENVLGERRDTMPRHLFASQYLVTVVPRSDRSFRIDDIHFYTEGNAPDRKTLNVLMFIDPADARGIGSSEWAVSIIGVDSDRRFWDLDSIKGKATAATITAEIIKKIRLWTPDFVICENTGFSRSYIDATLKPEIDKANLRVGVTEMTPSGIAKRARIMDIENGLGAVVCNGRFYMRNENYAGKVELQTFPGDSSYDWLDATSYIVRFVGERGLYPAKSKDAPVDEVAPWLRETVEWERRLIESRRGHWPGKSEKLRAAAARFAGRAN